MTPDGGELRNSVGRPDGREQGHTAMDVSNPCWMWYSGNPYGNRWSATELKPPLGLKWQKKLTGSSYDGTPVGSGDIFAVVITDIGEEASLSQHALTTPEVGDPCAAGLPPSGRAFEIQAELSESHSGNAVIGLVHIAVKHNLVHALAELAVAYGFRMCGYWVNPS